MGNRVKMKSDTLDFSLLNICTDCGEEYECGLLSFCNHIVVCKKDAPNESIEYHRIGIETKKIQQKARDYFAPVYNKMNNVEQYKYLCLSLCGIKQGDSILMGLEAFERFKNYEQEMINKYKN